VHEEIKQNRHAITVENSEKPQSSETAEELDNAEKQTSFGPRSLPRRCLSVEGATTNNHRMSLTPGPRPGPPSVYLEMEHMRRTQSTKTRRTRSNYSVGERWKCAGDSRNGRGLGWACCAWMKATGNARSELQVRIALHDEFDVKREMISRDRAFGMQIAISERM